MATNVIATSVEVRLTFLVKLGRVINIPVPVRIINGATYAVATIVTAIVPVVARRMMVLMLVAFSHTFNERSNDYTGNHGAGVISAVIVRPRTRVEAVASPMMISADVSKDPSASLGDPEVLAFRIIPPCPIEDAWAARYLVN